MSDTPTNTLNRQLPTSAEAKQHAKRLRAQLAGQETEISHAAALELVAHQNGYRDWNTFYAAIGNRPPDGWAVGGHVQGTYLSQPFEATVFAVEMVRPGWFRLTLDLDEPVDVVTFDSFSAFRKRIRGAIGPQGTSLEKTSNGEPQLKIDF